jgi:hypothetical protein
MQEQRTRDVTARDGAAAIGNSARVAPSSSRMLASYMTDIEQLLDEQRWDVALREALDLPQIAVALSDPHLSFTGERLKTWCDAWIRPAEPDRNARCAEYQRVTTAVLAHISSGDDTAMVPSLALKQLRLRRLVRIPARGFNAGRSSSAVLVPEGTNAIETCSIIVEAVRRWYAQSAVSDKTVQANLARLAVLR